MGRAGTKKKATKKKATKKRAYTSPLRERQAAQTRESILEAIAAHAMKGGIRDFSNRAVARLAGVSERTFYRHFPSQEALLDALDAEVGADSRAGSPMLTVDDLADEVIRGFAACDDMEPTLRALELSEAWRKRRARRHRASSPKLAKMLEPLCDRLGPHEVRRA